MKNIDFLYSKDRVIDFSDCKFLAAGLKVLEL